MMLLPSRRRPQRLRQFFHAFQAAKWSCEGVVLIDMEDYKDNSRAYLALEKPQDWRYVITETESMGDKIREVWPVVQDKPWLGLLNDDHVPKTLEGDKILISRLRGFNFVSCDDGWQKSQRAAGATLWSDELLQAVGHIFLPGMQHLFIDSVWEALGNATMCWNYVPEVLVEHVHTFRTGVADETHTKGYANWPKDEEIYKNWLQSGFDADVKKILNLKKLCIERSAASNFLSN